MPLSPGDKLGPYEILTPIGIGGMGEVYKARDTRLDRTVAVKVLPEHIAKREDLRARFEREARAVASLKHPNICTLYDIGLQDGAGYMVMEFMEGETLADRIAKGALPLDQALKFATQIADALDRAHRAGVTHRDVKPQNIMLTRDGAKVLDFGLAKSIPKVGPTDETLTAVLTTEGTVMGTPQYMAPEQFEGKEADARSDIWAFGAVLYEMVTGQKAFQGKSYSSLLGAILSADPPPMSVKPFTPSWLARLVKRCLQKDPDDRYQNMRDVVLDLSTQPQEAAAVEPPKTSRWPWTMAALAGALALALVAISFLHFRETPPQQRVWTTSVNRPPDTDFDFYTAEDLPQISPDSESVVFSARSNGKRQLWLHSLETGSAQLLNGTDGGALPFWSPDSRSIAFFADGKLKRIDLMGGPSRPLTLTDAPLARGGAWSPEGSIIFAPSSERAIFRVSQGGGIATELTRLGTERSHRFPVFLPDGRHFLYTVQQGQGSNNVRIRIGSLDATPEAQPTSDLLAANSNVIYNRNHLLFIREETLMAQKFDDRLLSLSGDAAPIAESVGSSLSAAGIFSASNDGALLYQHGTGETQQLVWFDRSGKRLGTVGAPATFTDVALSPSADRLATGQRGANLDLWTYDLARGLPTRFTFGPSSDQSPVWTRDGASLTFSSTVKGVANLYRQAADGSGSQELLGADTARKLPNSWSPDGKLLLFARSDPQTARDLWVLPMSGDRQPYPLLKTPFDEMQGQFSPDGRWVAYVSTEGGRNDVYAMSFPGAGSKRQISAAGGRFPRWSPDGKEIFYVTSEGVLKATAVYGKESAIEVGASRVLDIHLRASPPGWNYDIAPDGRILAAVSSGNLDEPLTLVQNWTALLRR
jgi:eukaryotic-like serine/threonine-protein kinase